MDAPLLLVGFQRGVRPALRSLGRPCVALVGRDAPDPVADELTGFAAVDLHGPLEPIVQRAIELLNGARPAAVVALAERTVLVASGLRERFGLPGNDTSVALRCADKVEMKRAMNRSGVPVADWCTVGPETAAQELVERLGLPLVLKPRRDSGGRGQSRFTDAAELAASLQRLRKGALERGYGWLAEAWIEGVEMSVESLLHAGRPCFQNPTEYFVPRHANILPAEPPPAAWSETREFVNRALRAAGVERGISHLELFHTSSGPVFGELAIRPPGGRLMTLLARAWSFDPWEALLRLELGERPDLPDAPRRTAGVWVLHPGAGRIEAIRGLEEARALPLVRRIALKVAAGDSIGKRMGTGQDIGAIYVEGPGRDDVARELAQARKLLRFDLI